MLSAKINECYAAMDTVSRVILRAGLALIGAMYFAAVVLLAAYGRFFPDYDTALCFISTLLDSAREVSGAVIVPVLLYETLGRAILRGRR